MKVKINEKEFNLPAIIGRDKRSGRICVKDKNAQIQVNEEVDNYVSRIHCVLTESHTGRVFAIDLGSANGTEIGGKKMPAGEPFPVNKTDDLKMGNSIVTIELV